MKKSIVKRDQLDARYQTIFGDVSNIIHDARRSGVRSVNAVMTAAYWSVGRHIVEFEQSGEERAEYGTTLTKRLADDLTKRFGRGFSHRNIQQMRLFYLAYPPEKICQTPSGELKTSPSIVIPQTPSAESPLAKIASCFPFLWVFQMQFLLKDNDKKFIGSRRFRLLSED